MARVTVEHELKKIKNPFDLVKKTAQRAHALAKGAPSFLTGDHHHKPTVLALKEIAEGI